MLRIDPTSPVPPYEQLRAQLVAQMGSGELAPGTRLPPVRRLASDLGLAPNTVARTYRELEASGFVRTAGRNGTIVQPPNDGPGQAIQLVRHFVESMRGLGVGVESAVQQVRHEYAALGAG